ncbi:MAG: serine hydrolase [Elusimicrobia bacterium]|nr:serine hydrolase [Elusimicrobiota bacterium]
MNAPRLSVILMFSLTAAASAAAPRDAGGQRGPRRGLIHPLLDVDPNREFSELRPFHHKMLQEIERQKKSGAITSASFYFRDLDNGPVISQDEHTPFKAASLLKVPVMFAVLKAAEKNPAILDRRIPALPLVTNRDQHFKTMRPVTAGQEYSVLELLRAMISGSDNGAVRALVNTLNRDQYLSVFTDLGLRIPNVRDLDNSVTVKEYGTFFRILYNASYLGREQSQLALEMLANSEFKRGLAAGVPLGVTIAHKFGETTDADGQRLLHDCGIVYHETRPYLLCLMTRGEDFDRLAGAIAALSNLAYREVDASARRERNPEPSLEGEKAGPGSSPDR